MESFSVSFSLADRVLKLRLPAPIQIGDKFLPFLANCNQADATVEFLEADSIPVPTGELVFRNHCCEIYRQESGYAWLYCDWQHDQDPSALVIRKTDAKNVSVQYLKSMDGGLSSAKACFFYIPLDDMLVNLDRLMLHAALVETMFGGILFCGPSGVGKSTQAELWHRYENSRIINGDRPVLGKVDGAWFAYGSPYAGSSCYYVNARVPLAAVVMLEQGPNCEIRRLGAVESFRKLYANTVMTAWNPEHMQRICDLLQDMSADVPVYHLVCTPDRQAVEKVKEILNREASS